MKHLPPARWAELVSAHGASGLSLEQFARNNNVGARSLGWWRARLKPAGVPAFVEVRVSRGTPPAPSPVPRVQLPAGVGIDVPVGVDLAWLRQVVEALS